MAAHCLRRLRVVREAGRLRRRYAVSDVCVPLEQQVVCDGRTLPQTSACHLRSRQVHDAFVATGRRDLQGVPVVSDGLILPAMTAGRLRCLGVV